MKLKAGKIVSVLLCFVLLFSSLVPVASAAGVGSSGGTGDSIFSGIKDVASLDDFNANAEKVFYNVLNRAVERLAKFICFLYPDPPTWVKERDYNFEGFMAGRADYQTAPAANSFWSLGYASRSLVPADVASGKYYLGRDLLNKKAQGVYDDQRIRVAVIDDNSGEGAVVIAAIDGMGVTSTDIRAIREKVLASVFGIASINIMSTHTHSALDTQGVSTEFFYKLFTNGSYNFFRTQNKSEKLSVANYFKTYFIEQSAAAICEAVGNMQSGRLYYSTVDVSEYVKDKRDLISKEDIPEAAVLRFIPDSGNGDTFITDISCHPTSFSASNGLVSADYIYYMDKYIKEQCGGNLVLFQGALGQLSRDNCGVDTTGMDEYTAKGAETKNLGEKFAALILAGDYSQELQPVLNAKHKSVWLKAENSILKLACEVGLVNNQVVYRDLFTAEIASEVGYLEFGAKVGFALFPGELYPEVFWGDEITGGVNWDGTEWEYDSLYNSVSGKEVHCVSLANDATGYVLTDNNFAFMGHIIGDGIADEILSAGKHMGSFLVESFLGLVSELA